MLLESEEWMCKDSLTFKKCAKISAEKRKNLVVWLRQKERPTLQLCVALIHSTKIFQRIRLHPTQESGTPPGSLIEVADHTFTTYELFYQVAATFYL